MKRKTTIKILLIVLIVIFELQFLSHLFQTIAPKDTNQNNARFFKLSHYFLPTDAEATFKYAYALLVKSRLKQDKEIASQSIKYFKRAIGQNMFLYKAHFFLAKAYLNFSKDDPQLFDSALQSFKRAIKIRGNNPEIVVDALTLSMSLWPHLNDEDKRFCRSQFIQIIPKLKQEQFLPILDVWGHYVKDFKLMANALVRAPQFYSLVAKALLQFDLDLELRHSLVAHSEIYHLEKVKVEILSLNKTKKNALKRLTYFWRYLMIKIKGYYRLVNEVNFNERNLFEIKGQIEQKLLPLLLDQQTWQKDLASRQKLIKFLYEILNTAHTRVNLENIKDILERKGFFNLNDLSVFYVRQQIDLKLNQIDAVINDTETLKQSISFVKKEHQEMYVKILLLLAKAYSANRLLSRAMVILEEVRKINPEPLEIYWQMMRIEQIIGADDENDPQKRAKYELLKTKNNIELRSTSWRGVVYLADAVGFNIRFADFLKEKLADHQVIQVFVNGLIHKEVLARGIGDVLQIVLPDTDRFAKLDVEIKII